MSNYGELKVFATTAGRSLAEKICARLGNGVAQAHIERFSDGEVSVQLGEEVRDRDVFIIAPTCPPAENFWEALFLCEAARASSAGRITYVIPYMGYGRSDRKDAPRKLIAARTAFEMLELGKPDRFIMLDVHAEQTLACIRNAVVDHLYGSKVALEPLQALVHGQSFVVAAPDQGASARAYKYARLLNQEDFVMFSKTRSAPGEINTNLIKIIGEVDGKVVILVDDMIDTGGTIVANAHAAKEAGAKKVIVFATHGLFSKDALERIKHSDLDEVLVTDSLPHDPALLRKKSGGKVTVISVDWLLWLAIKHTHEGKSLSKLIPH